MQDGEIFRQIKSLDKELNVALVEISENKDAYFSVNEALIHAGIVNSIKVNIHPVAAEDLEIKSPDYFFDKIDAIVVPGGFGLRGVEGMIEAAKYARENDIPYFGLSLGMQVAAIEFARNVLGLKDANSVEMAEETKNAIICSKGENNNIENLTETRA